MRRFLPLVLCLTLLLGVFSGCAAEDRPYVPHGDALAPEDADVNVLDIEEEEVAQELTLVYYPDRSMNPLVAATYTNRVLLSLIYQGLFAVDNSYNPTPILCSRYQVSADNKVWTFYVEVNAAFSDGTRVSINDVYASYEKAMATDYYKGRFTHVNSIAVSEDGGITFTLEHPYQNLPLLLDVPIVKASEVDAEFPLGSGPYVFTESSTGPCLMRVENWWCGSKTKLATNAQTISLIDAVSPAELRDEFESLEELCAALDANAQTLSNTLAALDYHYDPAANRFL